MKPTAPLSGCLGGPPPVQPNDHLPWVDAAKGIGIVLVVWGHVFIPAGIGTVIYSFHMPLFFFLSGYLLKSRLSIREFAAARARRLLVPYAVYGCLSGLYWLVTTRYIGATEPVSLRPLLSLLVPMERDYGVVGALWFLPALFAVEVGSALLVRVTRGGVPHGLCVLGLAATGFFWRSFSPVPLPLYWSVSLSGLLFYWAGTRARKGRLAAPEALGTNVIAAAALLPVVALAAPVNGKVSMAGMNYGNPLLFVPIALAGIAMTVAFAGIASRSRGLRFLGRNSLPIMALHLIVFSLLDAVRQAVLGTTYRELKGSLAAGLVHLALILAFLALLTPVINRITSRVSGR